MKFYHPTIKSSGISHAVRLNSGPSTQTIYHSITKDSLMLRFFKKIGLHLNNVKQTVKKYWATYALGTPDPLIVHNTLNPASLYQSWSGVDMRLYYKEGDLKVQVVPAQAISWNITHEGVTGTLIGVLLNNSLLNILPDSLFDFQLEGKNEYGGKIEILIKEIKPITYGSGCSIDDIQIEEQVTFEASSLTIIADSDIK